MSSEGSELIKTGQEKSNRVVIDKKGTALLYLNPEEISFSGLEKQIKQGFDPKKEFHITIIGFSTAREIEKLVGELPLESQEDKRQELKQLIESVDWSYTIGEEKYILEKDYPAGSGNKSVEHRMSIVQIVYLPEFLKFYEKLNFLLGTKFAPPPPHITLLTNGNKMGIGINCFDDPVWKRRKLVP